MRLNSSTVLGISLGLALLGCKNEGNAGVSSDGAISAAVAAPAGSVQSRIRIDVTSDGFVASGQRVKVGEPVTLVVTRKVDRTCATDIVIKDYGVQKALPQDQAVEVTFTPTKPGPIRYACAMDMVAGQLVAE